MPKMIGPCEIGSGTIVDDNVVIGYPGKDSLLKSRNLNESEGSRIGSNCILRAGTIIYEQSAIGDDVQFAHHVVIREGVTIGRGCVFGNGTVVREGARLGSNVRLMDGVMICEGAQISDNVFIGPNVSLTGGRFMTGAAQAAGLMSDQEARELEGRYWSGPSIVIEERAKIGSNAVLLAGIRIGRGATIAAGAVVSTDVPAGATAAGNPARLLKVAVETK